MLNCILYANLTSAHQTANIYFDEFSDEGLDLLKSLCESNQFYCIMVYAQLHSLRYVNICSSNGEHLFWRVFGRRPRPTKALCESNQFYGIMVYAQLHSLRYANICSPNDAQLICRVFYTICAEGFLAVDAGATMTAWVVTAFVAGPGKLVWHA